MLICYLKKGDCVIFFFDVVVFCLIAEKNQGEQCVLAGECMFENAVCLDSLCSCSDSTYEENEACVDSMRIVLLS